MEAKEAVRQSIREFGAVFPPSLQEELRLEEVALSQDEEIWLTTVSYPNPDLDVDEDSVSTSPLAAMLGPVPRKTRIYKTIRVRSTDGKLLGIVDSK